MTVENIGTLGYQIRVVTSDEPDPAVRTQHAQLVAVTSTAHGTHEGVVFETDPGAAGVAIDAQTAVLDRLGVTYETPVAALDPTSTAALLARIATLEAGEKNEIQAVEPQPAAV